MPEWLIGADCKSAARRASWVRILPPPPYMVEYAHIAQLVEHVLGKNGVTSSNLVVGFETRRLTENGKESLCTH